jgi:hypothetical protein
MSSPTLYLPSFLCLFLLSSLSFPFSHYILFFPFLLQLAYLFSLRPGFFLPVSIFFPFFLFFILPFVGILPLIFFFSTLPCLYFPFLFSSFPLFIGCS